MSCHWNAIFNMCTIDTQPADKLPSDRRTCYGSLNDANFCFGLHNPHCYGVKTALQWYVPHHFSSVMIWTGSSMPC